MSYSIFDQDLKDYNGEIHTTDPFTGQPVTTRELFTLNRENYDEARTFLIPRAVAYSAGLINYFFRGKIAMVPDPAPNNRGGFLITNLGTEDMEGTFTLYYDDADGTRHPAVRDSAHRPVSWRTTGPTGHGSLLQAGESMPVPAFVFPPDGEPEQVGDRVLVFTGRLGQEAPVDGSVGAVVAQVIPPSPFLLSVGGVQYRSTHLDQGWQVLNASGLHIERGAYIDDTLLFIRGSDAQQYGIWQSLDGGRSFTWFILPGIQYLSDVEHLGGNEMLAIGWQQSVGHARYYTMNLGETWSVLQTQTCGGCGWNGRVTYIGHRTLLANVGLLQTTGEGLAQSTDLGLTWTDIDPVLDGQVLSSMGLWNPADWFINALVWNQVEGPGSVLLAGGYLFKHDSEGAQVYGLWKSVDEGQTWRHVTTTPDIDTYNATINSLALDRQGNALMTASDDMLYRSTDAGETWEPATPPVAGGDLEGLVYLRSHLPPPQRPEP